MGFTGISSAIKLYLYLHFSPKLHSWSEMMSYRWRRKTAMREAGDGLGRGASWVSNLVRGQDLSACLGACLEEALEAAGVLRSLEESEKLKLEGKIPNCCTRLGSSAPPALGFSTLHPNHRDPCSISSVNRKSPGGGTMTHWFIFYKTGHLFLCMKVSGKHTYAFKWGRVCAVLFNAMWTMWSQWKRVCSSEEGLKLL